MVAINSEILLKRLKAYAISCQKLTLLLSKTEYNFIYCKQLIRSSSSPAANYIEAIEASSSKDFVHRLKVCRKEVKESVYWIELIKETNVHMNSLKDECSRLIVEGTELLKIFSAAIVTTERNQKIKKMEK